MASKKYRSILHEMSDFMPHKDKEEVVEARAQHIIASAINLLQSIHESFDPAEAELLEKRFLSSIKAGDVNRFNRQITKIKESRDEI